MSVVCQNFITSVRQQWADSFQQLPKKNGSTAATGNFAATSTSPSSAAWTSCSSQSCCCCQSQAEHRAVHSGWRVPACELRLTAPEESLWETTTALRLPRKSWWKHGNARYCLSLKTTCNQGMGKNLCQVGLPPLMACSLSACMHAITLFSTYRIYLFFKGKESTLNHKAAGEVFCYVQFTALIAVLVISMQTNPSSGQKTWKIFSHLNESSQCHQDFCASMQLQMTRPNAAFCTSGSCQSHTKHAFFSS